MNQQKIGEFMKELRKEKGLTQEQFAEILNVSNRTVSRWENGNNLPDVSVLIEISDYYEVDLRELLNGERKVENMNKETKETVLKAVEYTNDKFAIHTRYVSIIMMAAIVFWEAYMIITRTGLVNISALSVFADFAEGVACGLMIGGVIMMLVYGMKLKSSAKKK